MQAAARAVGRFFDAWGTAFYPTIIALVFLLGTDARGYWAAWVFCAAFCALMAAVGPGWTQWVIRREARRSQ